MTTLMTETATLIPANSAHDKKFLWVRWNSHQVEPFTPTQASVVRPPLPSQSHDYEARPPIFLRSIAANHGLSDSRLETIQIGGTCCTSKEPLIRFFDRLTESRSGQSATGSASDGGSQENRDRVVEAALDGLGF